LDGADPDSALATVVPVAGRSGRKAVELRLFKWDRGDRLQSALIPLAISVDGVERRGLRSGGRLELDLTPGPHDPLVGNDSIVPFDNSASNAVHIKVWISTFSSRGRARIVAD
jgi:hypothetical protein